MYLPVPNTKYQEHFLATDESIKYINTYIILFERLNQVILDAKAKSDENKSLKRSEEIDKGKSFVATKVSETVECDSCDAVLVIYSYHSVG